MDKDEKVKELSKKLLDGVRQTFESNRFKQYLKIMSVFQDYSPRNIALIFQQNPHATQVASFEAWKELDRYVRRGETGISIFVPIKTVTKVKKPILDDAGNPIYTENGSPKTADVDETLIRFQPSTVFDISQTDGKPLPALCNELQSAVPDFQKIFAVIKKLSPFKIEFENLPDGEKGTCSYAENKIVLKPGMSDEQIVKTLLHEYAHAVLYSETKKSKERKEIEAESIAFLVSDFLGIDTSGYSFDYVSVWSYGMDTEQLQEILESIQSSANDIIHRIDTAMKSLETEQTRKPMKLPERLSEAVKKTENYNTEKEMIPNGKVVAQ